MTLSRDHARIALATIRLVNGAVALLAPEVMLRRFEAAQEASLCGNPDPGRVAVYPLRMFGIRTVVLAIQLFASGSPRQSGSVLRGLSVRQQGETGVVIHATDAASAITAGLRRQLPARVAIAATGISVINTVLAWILATDRSDSDGAGSGRRPDSSDFINGRRSPSAARLAGALNRNR